MSLLTSSYLVAIALIDLVASASSQRLAGRADQPRAAGAVTLAAGKLWAPKKSMGGSGEARGSEAETSREEEELLKPRTASPPPSAPARPRLRIKSETPVSVDVSDGGGEENAADEDAGQGDKDESDNPGIRKRHRRDADEDDADEDDDAPLPSLPPVLPRLGVLGVGASTMGRSFHYDTPLQGDSAAVRLGYAMAFESFPLLRTPPGFHRRIGLGGSFEHESGTASLVNAADGTTISYPLTQSRWGLDARYFLPFGPHLLLVPAVGFGRSDADLGARTGTLPSACLPASARPCVADVAPSFMTFDLHGRLAVSPVLSFSITAGYELGVSVASGLGRIPSSEATATMRGFHVDLGARYLLQDWLALEAQLPFRRHAYTFAPVPNSAASYHDAVDSYYGLVVGVAVLSP